MTDEPAHRLSGEEIAALKFASHRQLARWSNKRDLSPRQHAQRIALASAVRTLQDKAFADGCELRVPSENVDEDDWRKIERGLFESDDGQWRIANPWRLNSELRHRWLVAERDSAGSGWCMHGGDHATLHEARAYVEAHR